MKTIITPILALTISTPLFADTSVPEPHFARDNTGIESVVVEEKSPLTSTAQQIFADLASEDGTGIETKSVPELNASGTADGPVNANAATWFMNQRASEGGSEK